MKLIIGLGNPGAKYNFTRHNFGFLALDFYAKTHGLEWNKTEKFHSVFASFNRAGQNDENSKILFLKPQTFYNDSGLAVQEALNFYKLQPSDILVICDNFDLEFGKIRYREQGTAGGNNGLKSITATLKTDQYPRLRLGTGNNELRQKLGDIDFVLSKFTPKEKAKLPEILHAISAQIDHLL